MKVGQRAPDFTLYDFWMKHRKLSEYLGNKVILAFYPGAFTTICLKELSSFRNSMAKLGELGARVIAISVNDPFTNKAFAEQNAFNFPLLSDYNREVIKLYDVAQENFVGLEGYTVAKRSIFILDRKGKIRYKWISEDPTKEPNYSAINRFLAQIP